MFRISCHLAVLYMKPYLLYANADKRVQRTTFIQIYIYNLSRSDNYLQQSGEHTKQKPSSYQESVEVNHKYGTEWWEDV